ncbi:hypothetical protein DPMN_152276 [Dreissena polymorpha]|uniref:Uncharacterized protein n=1 Tax=Dreissena polymorpha TaxID=45954 RepID=A0A9D4FJ78_DREPO|nr:hypothetical protein DPMN_152276 [Dreissena polymorpha]
MYLVGKLMKLLVHNLLSLAIAAVAMAILIRTSAILGQVCAKVGNAGHILYVITFHGDIFTGVGRTVHNDLRFLRADLHPVCSCSFEDSVGIILKFTADATHAVNVISES